MGSWTDVFDKYLGGRLTGVDAGEFWERYGWVDDYAARAAGVLSSKNLSSMPPQEIYAALDSLTLPHCQIRMTNLGRVNTADEVVGGIRNLLEKPGDFSAKYRAGKIPQAGIVTLTQILMLARPDRFVIRNAAMTRAVAKQVPFYTTRALDELGYEEYLDICRELTRPLVALTRSLTPAAWSQEHRFLLLYAVLTV